MALQALGSLLGERSRRPRETHRERRIRVVSLLARRYFRVRTLGVRNIPEEQAAIILPNHSGWAGIDALVLESEIARVRRRSAWVLAHKAFFSFDRTRVLARRLGFREASFDTGKRLLTNRQVVVLFPEGEGGNFKPTAERYRLREFRTGFLRMALATGAAVVPTVVIGAEETHLNLASLRVKGLLRLLPVPLNLVPLPARWRIRFLPAIALPKLSASELEDRELLQQIALSVREKMQAAINAELKKRRWVFFRGRRPGRA